MACDSVSIAAPFFELKLRCETCGLLSTDSCPVYSPNFRNYLGMTNRPWLNRIRVEAHWSLFCLKLAASYIADIWRKRNPFEWEGR